MFGSLFDGCAIYRCWVVFVGMNGQFRLVAV